MTLSRLCETVTGRTMTELISARDAVDASDMVELRLDGVAGLDVAAALAGRRRPVVVTCRAPWEGGRFDGTEEERWRILGEALTGGAEFVDVEWAAVREEQRFADLIARDGARIVLSFHDFANVPADLNDRVRQMRASGAGTIKVAVAAARLSDTLPLVDVARAGDAVVVAMGEAGVPTRLLATRYGSRWTYAGDAHAPGQIPAGRMIDEFRFRQIGSRTRLFGVVSTNAMHSVSPVMHNAAFAAAGLDAVYVPLRAADFDDFQCYASAMGIEGVSVTIPFKGAAFHAAAQWDDLTRQAGAANTLRRIVPPESGPHDGAGVGATFSRSAWDATNTDVAGFLAPLEPLWGDTLRGMRASVLGAGGAARSVVVALLSRGARVTVHARRAEQARAVTAALGADVGAWPPAPGSWDVLVNCTPLGGATSRDQSPLPGGPFDGRLVYDLTYGPGESALVQEARAAGCATLDGLPMLIAQAERQFEWWTGNRPHAGVMRDAAYARLGIGRQAQRQAHEAQKHRTPTG